jgi:integrase
VPGDLLEAIGHSQIWLSLDTSVYSEACKSARIAAVRLDIEFDNHRKALKDGKISLSKTLTDVTESELRRVVASDFWTSQQSLRPTVYEGEFSAIDIASLEHELGGLQDNDPSALASLLVKARSIIRERDLPISIPDERALSKTPPDSEATTNVPKQLTHLIQLLRRSEMEKLKRAIDKLDGGHGDQSFDPLFDGINSVSVRPSAGAGTTLSEAILRFGTDPTRAHFGDTAAAKYVVPFRAMKEIIGADRLLSSIDRADCAAVQEIISGLPANVSKLKAYADLKTLRAIVSMAKTRTDPLMSPTTVRVYTHTLTAFFNWSIGKGLLTINPASRLAQARGPSEISKRPFSIGELNSIVGSLAKWSDNNRLAGRYWVPLIAIFSGMRLGEIVSLTVQDILIKDDVRCFILRRTEDKKLKTQGSERVVPVHPELIRLGLLKQLQLSVDQGKLRLFPDLPGDDQKQLSDLFQKRFAYWQKKVLKLSGKGISFHSFRHGFRDALREAGVPIDTTRALGGWARSGGIEERYGQGTRPSTLAKWMDLVTYRGLAPLSPLV